MKKNFKNKISLLLCFSLVFALTPSYSAKTKSLGAFGHSLLRIERALAATVLDPATMNLATDGGKASFARFLLYFVTGPAPGYTINGLESGLAGLIDTILGPDALGGGLAANGIDSCSAIPATGSVSMTDPEGTFVMTFGTASKTVPAHFNFDTGNTFEKKVSISLDGTPMMVVELNCETAGKVSGYIRFTVLDENRAMETYFQRDSVTLSGAMEFYMDYDDGAGTQEKVAARLISTDGDSFDMWFIRASDAATDDGAYLGLTGSRSTALVKLNHIFVNNVTNNAAINAAASVSRDYR